MLTAPPGPLHLSTIVDYTMARKPAVHRISTMTPKVRTEDLIDANEVAALLGLRHRNSVTTYQRRYPDMPKPVLEKSGGRTRLWLRSEIEAWKGKQASSPRVDSATESGV